MTRTCGLLVEDIVVAPDESSKTIAMQPRGVVVVRASLSAEVTPGALLLSIWESRAGRQVNELAPAQVWLGEAGMARITGLVVGRQYRFRIRGRGLVGDSKHRIIGGDSIEIRLFREELAPRVVRVVDDRGAPVSGVLVAIYSPEGTLADRHILRTDANGEATAALPGEISAVAIVSDPRYIAPYVVLHPGEVGVARVQPAGSIVLRNLGTPRLLRVEYTIRGRLGPSEPRRVLSGAEWKLERVPAGDLHVRVLEVDRSGAVIEIVYDQSVRVPPLGSIAVDLDE
jgi:hypothetical protein